MIVKTVPVTDYATNCYIIACPETHEALVVDPGGEAELILEAVHALGADVKYIVVTHAHGDHIGALQKVKDATGAAVAMHPAEAERLTPPAYRLPNQTANPRPPIVPDLLLAEGDDLAAGMLRLRVLHTPGHTPGHVSLVGDKAAFVGDVLFFQGVGRTDMAGGSHRLLIDSIKRKLLPLGDDMRVYPGHGPATTIGLEREYNPFLAD